MLNKAFMIGAIEKYWPDDAELAGEDIVDTQVSGFLSDQPAELVHDRGGSDWAALETAATILAICQIIKTTLEIVKEFRKENTTTKQAVEVELRIRLPEHTRGIRDESIQAFIADQVDN